MIWEKNNYYLSAKQIECFSNHQGTKTTEESPTLTVDYQHRQLLACRKHFAVVKTLRNPLYEDHPYFNEFARASESTEISTSNAVEVSVNGILVSRSNFNEYQKNGLTDLRRPPCHLLSTYPRRLTFAASEALRDGGRDIDFLESWPAYMPDTVDFGGFVASVIRG